MVYTRAGAVRDYDVARDRAADRRGDAVLDRRPRGGADRGARRGARQRSSSAATATPSRPPTAPTGWPAPRSPTSSASRRSPAPTASRSASTARSRRRPGALRAKLFRSGAPLALSDMLPMFENMGVRGRRRASVRDHAARRRAASGSTTSASTTRRARRARDRRGCASASRTPSCGSGAARSRTTATTALVLRAGLTWREVTVLRAVGKVPAPGRHDLQRPLRRAGAGRALRDRRGCSSSCSSARFDPDHRDAAAGATGSGAEIERAIDAVESLDQDRILRSFLAVIQAMLRTNYFQPTAGGEPKPYLSFKLDPSQLPLAAAAAPAVRDLRLLAARRGRAPARRQGRARRASAGRTGARTSAPRCSG